MILVCIIVLGLWYCLRCTTHNKQELVVIPVDLANKIVLPIGKHNQWPLRDISSWMKYHGYTDTYMPIIFSSNNTN